MMAATQPAAPPNPRPIKSPAAARIGIPLLPQVPNSPATRDTFCLSAQVKLRKWELLKVKRVSDF